MADATAGKTFAITAKTNGIARKMCVTVVKTNEMPNSMAEGAISVKMYAIAGKIKGITVKTSATEKKTAATEGTR